MKRKEKGFTLVELLAVIVILGVIMLIAIPAVSKYIDTSRRKSYISSARSYIHSVKNKNSALKYKFSDESAVYYLPIKCIEMEKPGNSPYGRWVEAYVMVTVSGINYTYYWTSFDNTGKGIVLASESELNTSLIIPGVKSINKNMEVGGNTNPVIMDSDTCKFDY